jgi:hypothetical protein
MSKRVSFSPLLNVFVMWGEEDYNRKGFERYKHLSTQDKREIKQELNHFKRYNMIVHPLSEKNTKFH